MPPSSANGTGRRGSHDGTIADANGSSVGLGDHRLRVALEREPERQPAEPLLQRLEAVVRDEERAAERRHQPDVVIDAARADVEGARPADEERARDAAEVERVGQPRAAHAVDGEHPRHADRRELRPQTSRRSDEDRRCRARLRCARQREGQRARAGHDPEE